MTLAPGPRSKISPKMWMRSTARRWMTLQKAMTKGLARDDRRDDAVVVRLLILHLLLLVQKLFDDIGVVFGKRPSHLGARILGRDAAVDAHQAVDGRLVPIVEFLFRRFDEGKLLLGIVDERCERFLLLGGEGIFEFFVDLLADGARTVLQDVQEGFVLAVDVGDEVLGALGQVENGRKVDDLHGGVVRRRILQRELLQIAFVLHRIPQNAHDRAQIHIPFLL